MQTRLGGKTKHLAGKVAAGLLAFGLALNPLSETLAQNNPKQMVAAVNKKANAGLLQNIPKKYRTAMEKNLKRLDEIGCTPEQKEEYVKAAALAIKKTGKNAHSVLAASKSLLKRPDATPEAIEKFVDLLEVAAKEVKEFKDPEEPDNVCDSGCELWSLLIVLEKMFQTDNFKLEMLDWAKSVVENADAAPPGYVLAAFLAMLKHPDFEPEMLEQADSILAKKGYGYKTVKTFFNIASNPSSSPKFLNEINAAKEDSYSLLGVDSPEIYMNFAYAFNAIGREKTLELHKKGGLVYFGRYTKETLEEAYASLNPNYEKETPLLVIMLTKEDWNDAFYNSGLHIGLDKLYSKYRLMLFEVDSKKDFYKMLEETAQNYKRIDVLVLGGHGTPDNIYLGLTGDDGKVSISDEKELAELKDSFVENPALILVSCSTGYDENSIGALISKLWDAEVWAPKKPSGDIGYVLDANGKIKGVKYSDKAGKKFKNGLVVPAEK